MLATQNRLSSHGPETVGAPNGRMHRCKYKGCKCKFPTIKGLNMHVGRLHTHTIPTASPKKIRAGLAKARTKFAGVRMEPVAQVKAPKGALSCSVNGPGLHIQFAPDLLPTILHTIALALSGGQ